jgi:hypothetical protein
VKTRLSLLGATMSLAIAGASAPSMAAAPGPVYGEPNCSGQYIAYLNSIVNGSDAYANGEAGVAAAYGWTVKQLHDAIDAACGK